MNIWLHLHCFQKRIGIYFYTHSALIWLNMVHVTMYIVKRAIGPTLMTTGIHEDEHNFKYMYNPIFTFPLQVFK